MLEGGFSLFTPLELAPESRENNYLFSLFRGGLLITPQGYVISGLFYFVSVILIMHTLLTTETFGLGTCLELVGGVDTEKREKLKLAWEAVSGTYGSP